MKRTVISIITCGFVLVAGLLHQISASGDNKTINAKELFESKCKTCHTIERPKSKRKTKTGWETTVTRMKMRNGAPITDEETKLIIDYLAKEYGPQE